MGKDGDKRRIPKKSAFGQGYNERTAQSKKYEISDKCKYYMSELDGEQAILVDKTSKTDDLFYKLAISFENLMNEEELYED